MKKSISIFIVTSLILGHSNSFGMLLNQNKKEEKNINKTQKLLNQLCPEIKIDMSTLPFDITQELKELQEKKEAEKKEKLHCQYIAVGTACGYILFWVILIPSILLLDYVCKR